MKKNTAIGLVLLLVFVLIGYYLVTRNSVATPVATSTATTSQNTDTDTTTDTTPASTAPAAPSVVTNSSVTASGSVAIVNGKVRPNGKPTTYWFEYGTTTALGLRTTPQAIGSGYAYNAAPGYISGLAANSQYYFRLVAQNSFGAVDGPVFPFQTNNNPAPANALPSVLSVSSNAVNRTVATLNGQVTPKGYDTAYWFEYGTTPDLGNTTMSQSAGNGMTAQNVTMQIQNLSPLTKYYFRLNAQNQFGTVNSQTISFMTTGPANATQPKVTTTAATTIGTTTATLVGLINPDSADTTYWFEYGDTANLSHVIGDTSNGDIGTGNVNTTAHSNVTGLQSKHTYYYRIIARNTYGTVTGNIVSFNTK